MDLDRITEAILRESIAIHRDLGPRLLESTYEAVLADALQQAGFSVECQVFVPIIYRGRRIAKAYRLDMLVEKQVVVECKSMDRIPESNAKQLLTYLRLGGYPVGLILNFGGERLMDGVKRLVNNHRPSREATLRVNRPPSA